NMELDLYGGFAGETEAGLSWDVGVIGYIYPDADDLDFLEVYGGLGFSFDAVSLGGYLYFDPDNETVYFDASAGFSASDVLSFDVTAGTYLDGFDEYTNYSVGATFSTEIVDFDLRVWGTDVDDDSNADERVVLTVSRSL
ncbi:MAG: TorF family putative porin, partial [Pseudomonadota bacterium]